MLAAVGFEPAWFPFLLLLPVAAAGHEWLRLFYNCMRR